MVSQCFITLLKQGQSDHSRLAMSSFFVKKKLKVTLLERFRVSNSREAEF